MKKNIVIKNKSETSAEIILYGDIGESFWWDSISAKDFSEELDKLPKSVTDIDLRINSPGGDVFDGIAIYNRIKTHKANFTVYIDGLAASIASVIALAGDTVNIGEGALFMIHNPWTFSMGESRDLRETADLLDKIKDQIIAIYQRKSRQEPETIAELMDESTWMDADQAIELGFVDNKTEEDEEVSAAASLSKASWIKNKPVIDELEEKEDKEDVIEIDNRLVELKKEVLSFLNR